MSRKHFKKMAEIISKENDRAFAKRCAELLADFCKAENPAFDRQRFFDACGLN